MLQRMSLIFLASVCLTAFAAAQENTQELDDQARAAWRSHIQPTDDEIAWTKIDWKPNLSSSIAAAAKVGKPILLWTMNGHPFGCT